MRARVLAWERARVHAHVLRLWAVLRVRADACACGCALVSLLSPASIALLGKKKDQHRPVGHAAVCTPEPFGLCSHGLCSYGQVATLLCALQNQLSDLSETLEVFFSFFFCLEAHLEHISSGAYLLG